MPVSIPPYLTSGASSRSHHALIVALNESKSPQEDDAIAQKEIQRVRGVFSSNPSTSRICESLVIILHCCMVVQEKVNLEWALVPALQLAEGGKSLKERRIGYLYLGERLPPEHELGLMLINTIRKDLSSSKAQEILLALNDIIHLPSPDLFPAVQPLLVSKPLLQHDHPSVRQKTLGCLTSLYFSNSGDLSKTVGPRTFPVTFSKLVKMLNKETDAGVIGSIMRLMRCLLSDNVHVVSNSDEKRFIVETLIAQSRRHHSSSQIALAAMRVLQVILKPDDASFEIAIQWLSSVMRSRRSSTSILLGACSFSEAFSSSSTSQLVSSIIKRISTLLSPRTSTSAQAGLPSPNDHVIALRCLTILSPAAWDGLLGDNEMRCVMEGLNSVDDTVRLATLRLLRKMSSELLDAAYGNHLESLASSSNLALPLNLPEGLDVAGKLRLGRLETAGRALEVVKVKFAAMLNEADAAKELALGISGVCKVLSDLDGEAAIWEQELKSIVDELSNSSPMFRVAFVQTIMSVDAGRDQTIAVIRAMATAEYGDFDPSSASKVVSTLLRGIASQPSNVQELLLVAGVGIISRVAGQANGGMVLLVERALDEVREDASGYMQKRCSQIEKLVSDPGLLKRLDEKTKSRSLPDLLTTLISLTKPPTASTSTSSITSPAFGSRSLARSALRYDAYAPPGDVGSRSASRSRAAISPRPSAKTVNSPGAMSAGEYTLFSADEQELSEASALMDEEGLDNLVGLSLGNAKGTTARPNATRRISDPFRNDDDGPATPRLR